MLSAADVLKMLVGLKEVSDLGIVSSEAVLSRTCSMKDRPKILRMAAIVDQLSESFDYEKSPEFEATINGKSEELQTMHRKLLSADRRKRLVERFGKAITEIRDSREAYNLLPTTAHDLLDELKTIASSLDKPI